MIRFDINSFNNNISNNNKGKGPITYRLGGWFLLILFFPRTQSNPMQTKKDVKGVISEIVVKRRLGIF